MKRDNKRVGIELLKRGMPIRFQAQGGSMRPWLKNGDTVEVEPVEWTELKSGDVVLYRSAAGNWFAHRLIKKLADGRLVCQGDAGMRPDPPVNPEQVLGRVGAVRRNSQEKRLAGGNKIIGWIWANSAGIRPFIYPLVRRMARIKRRSEDPVKQLMLLCTKARWREDEQETVKKLVKRLTENDWEDFIRLAKQHHLTGNLYQHLRSLNGLVPRWIIDQLRKDYFTIAAHNLRLIKALKELSRGFSQNGIEFIPLKGVSLAERLCYDCARRPTGDLDLLVRAEDLNRAQGILEDMGYRSGQKSYSDRFIQRFFRHLGFMGRNGVYVELHWNFFLPQLTSYDMTKVWENSLEKRIDGIRLKSLSINDMIIHLAINLRLHNFTGLKLYGDLYEALSIYREKIDWGYVIREAARNGQRTGLYYALYFCKRLLGGEVPDLVLSRLKPGFLKDRIVRMWVNEKMIIKPKLNGARVHRYDQVRLFTVDRIQDAVRMVTQVLLVYPRDIGNRYGLRG
jgi:hypothetical protein